MPLALKVKYFITPYPTPTSAQRPWEICDTYLSAPTATEL